LEVVIMRIAFLGDVTAISLAEKCWHFRWMCYLHLQRTGDSFCPTLQEDVLWYSRTADQLLKTVPIMW